MNLDDVFDRIHNGDRLILGKAITLVESSLASDSIKKDALIEKCTPFSGNSIRIGVSGSPGVGKSTFIEKLGLLWLKEKKKIAILAIDPSSSISKGSILGDKTRMTELANNENVFIRPSPSRGSLGGICESTQETIILCEAAGYDIIIIETVGVGQSETIAESITDIFLYLTLMDNGDEIQFIKKGIIELSDIIIINKSDLNKQKANLTKLILENNINFSTNKLKSVFICSSIKNENIHTILDNIATRYRESKQNGLLKKNRQSQRVIWLQEIIISKIKSIMEKDSDIQHFFENFQKNSNTNVRKTAEVIISKLLK